MNGQLDVDESAIKRVIGGADVVMALGSAVPEAQRDWICRQLGARNESFRAAWLWATWYGAAVLASGLLFCVALTAILLGLPSWASLVPITASVAVSSVVSVQLYRVVRRMLAMAVGACVMVSGGND